MITARPLWPGKSDIDQLFHIVQTLGALPARHVQLFSDNKYFKGLQIPEPQPDRMMPLASRFRHSEAPIIEFLSACLVLEASTRATCTELMAHRYFDGFREPFEEHLAELFSAPPSDHRRKSKKRERRSTELATPAQSKHLPKMPLLKDSKHSLYSTSKTSLHTASFFEDPDADRLAKAEKEPTKQEKPKFPSLKKGVLGKDLRRDKLPSIP
eukprot:m.77627 g.77627  ORF g.77627 m.77627 type:complete len:212 (-) comp8141_c0_seq2:70-705(-)